jgi:hypothetical protein
MTSRLIAGGLLTAFLTAAPAGAQRSPVALPVNLPPDVLALACAPYAALSEPEVPLRVTGGQAAIVRQSYAPGDLITINAGSQNGIQVGQEFFTRRLQVVHKQAVSRETPGTIRTSGWIRVYAVDDEMSLATITHACGEVAVDDFLEPFVLPTPPVVATDRTKPERDNYGRVLSGSDSRRVFGRGDYFLLDRGADHGIAPGAQFVLYRDKLVDGNFLYDLGEAVAVSVSENTATLQVTVSRDAIMMGDYVAIRPPREDEAR